MRDIARDLGVAQSTVSRALSSDPRISEPMRVKVRAAAERLGYRPNPFVSAFTAQVRSYRHSPEGATIAILHCGPRSEKDADLYTTGARERAEALGFGVEVFWFEDLERSEQTLKRMLWTRSIPGLLILPVPSGFDFSGMPLDHLAVSTVDPSLQRPMVHRATPDYFQAMRLTLSTLVERGYERIAFCTFPAEMDRIGARWVGAQLYWQFRHKLPRIDPYVVDPNWDRSRFEKWLARNRPEVLVSNLPIIHRWLSEMGVNLPSEIGFVGLYHHHQGDSEVARIDQRSNEVAAAAIDLIVGQIYRNEYGHPDVAKSVSVLAKWVDGPTIRPAAD